MPLAYVLAVAIGSLLVLVSAIFGLRPARPVQTMPEVIEPSAAEELPAVVHTHTEDVPLPDEPSNLPPLAQEPIGEANEAALAPLLDQHDQDAEEFGSAVAWSSWHGDKEPVSAPEPPAASEVFCESPHALEEPCQAEEFAREAEAERLTWEPEVEELPAAFDAAVSDIPAPVSEESMGLVDSEDEELIIVGEPILQDAIPETLEVSWTEPLFEDDSKAKEQESIKIVSPWS